MGGQKAPKQAENECWEIQAYVFILWHEVVVASRLDAATTKKNISKEQIGLFKSYSGFQCCLKVVKLGYVKESKTL